MRYPFLNVIRDSVINLCDNNSSLLVRGGECERSCQFVIAHFLANSLIVNNLFIDCEFGRLDRLPKKIYHYIDETSSEKEKGQVFPDIIYHDRKNQNIFVIEIKIKEVNSNTGKIKDDRIKVCYYLAGELAYDYGFCISDITPINFTIHIIRPLFYEYDLRLGGDLSVHYKKENTEWKEKIASPTIFTLYNQ